MPLNQHFRGTILLKTRKEKREQEKGTNYFFELLKIQKHFFKDLDKKLGNVKDPRHQSYISYDTSVLFMMIILKNASNLESMRSMTSEFNKDKYIENLRKSLGIKELEEIPHCDTINDFLSELDKEELEKIRTYMIRELLKKKCFNDHRINEKYWGIIFDGTGIFTFEEKHCDHCLKRERKYKDKKTGEEKTKIIYMHHVLEAKLVAGDMVFSIDSEFIENESEDVDKQDCELNAFYRMAPRLKQTFKRLPICIMGDSIYACENVFDICKEYNWKYLIRFKEARIPSISSEFKEIKAMGEAEYKKHNQSQSSTWVNDIAYRQHKVSVLEHKEDANTFTFVTNFKVTKKNAKKLANHGRRRWKIENEGFNRQKNWRYHIEHASSENYNAMKNHYLLTQITDMIMMLYERGSKAVKESKKTIKEISSDLLDSLRNKVLTNENISELGKPMQVRFT